MSYSDALCVGCGGDENTCICDSSCSDSRISTITRAALSLVVEQAINAGKDTGENYLTREQITLQIDSIRDAIRTCRGVDYSCFDRYYGCPVTQAGLRGWSAFWFTRWFDTLMHAQLEPEPDSQLESGWSARVED